MTKHTTRKIDTHAVGVRLGLCAAAIAGTAATAPVANAGIITFNTPIPVPATFGGVYINLLTGATGGSAAAVSGWDFNPYLANASTQLGFYWAPAPAGGVASTTSGPYLDLPVGSVVGPSSVFSRTILATDPAFLTTGSHILGFAFENEDTSETDYGYLTLSTTGPSGLPATILGWSFDDTGAAITVGGSSSSSTPEPASFLLTGAALAIGALEMRRWRRRRLTASK